MHSLRPRCAFSGRESRLAIASRFIGPSGGIRSADRMGRDREWRTITQSVAAGFDVRVTMDSNMVHQQNIGQYAIAVVALRAASNRLANTRPLMPALLALLQQIQPGTVTFLPETA